MEPKMIESDRKFWSVPVVITSTVWEHGYHIYEADSAEAALEMYESEKETPHDVEYTGWMDQEFQGDEHDDLDEVEEMNNGTSMIQYILGREENERDEREEANREEVGH